MHALDVLAALHSRGADILSAVHGFTVPVLARRCGLPRKDARSLLRLAETFHGPTKFTRRQEKARSAAAANGHGVETLRMIDTQCRRLPERERWALRVELCEMAGTYEEIASHARHRVAELTTADAAAVDHAPELSVRHDHTNHRTTFTLTTGTRFGVDLVRSLEALAGEGRRRHALGRAFVDMLTSGGGVERATYTPMVIISARDLTPLLDGTGDDILLASDDGTLITGKELLDARLADHGFAGIFHPETGGLNLYRTTRFASTAQRIMARAENPVCPKKGCGRPSIRGEYHHLHSWGLGGNTDMPNLCACCAWDNAANDDHPATHVHGRLIRHDGHVQWQPPFGGDPVLSDHPVSRRGAMHLV